jgi:membrane peptidoglycan carboxypeptidase
VSRSMEPLGAVAQHQNNCAPTTHVKLGLSKMSFRYRCMKSILIIVGVVGLLSLSLFLLVEEIETSKLQASFLAEVSKGINTEIVRRSSSRIRFPQQGPYDVRLGYTQIPHFSRRLENQGYRVTRQAQISPRHADLIDMGIFPQYREKFQAGLQVVGADADIVYQNQFPGRVFMSFHEIPKCVVDTLLFIEDKHILTERTPFHNPAVEWDRFLRAIFDVAISKFDTQHDVHGGSTLATQIEKFRHSSEGRTQGSRDKLLQMASAALRSYRGGAANRAARERIVLNYINSVPLAAIRGFGEVNGLGDGLWAYYRVNFERVKKLLGRRFSDLSNTEKQEFASIYRKVLSLFLAHRRPSDYLTSKPEVLENQVQRYLPLMAHEGVISPELAELAKNPDVVFRTQLQTKERELSGNKTSYTIRSQLLNLLKVPLLYELDRFDLKATSTLYSEVQEKVVAKLESLRNAEVVRKNRLYGRYLFEENDDLKNVITSVTIYEKTPRGNMLRIQADNYDQPLNISQGVKLDLGSTSKLRTLITYLQVIERIYLNYWRDTEDSLKNLLKDERDPLTVWVLQYILGAKEHSVRLVLEAALDRKYSASPAERFFTAGGLHTFHNFNNRFNGSQVTMREALRHSINLPFIRLMRDIVRYYAQFVGVSGLSSTEIRQLDGETRARYLRKFADKEGRKFMRGFYQRYESKSPSEILLELQRGTIGVEKRFGAFVWELKQPADFREFFDFLRSDFPEYGVDEKTAQSLFERFDAYRDSLSDRSYIARIHPLELWTAAYMYKNPGSGFRQLLRAGKTARQAAYRWLFVTKHRAAQDNRIRIIVESEAFQLIHKEWVKLGYPHSFLVPSYASALGVSADTPDALARLMGILLNDGMSRPYYRFSEVHLAADTPFETLLQVKSQRGNQVLSRTLTEVVREAAKDVVKNGTATRIRGGLSDGKRSYFLGGKTGTGDHRHMVYRKGRAVVAEVRNRSANFVFFLGDSLFGTVTIFVPGKAAADYSFTSSLAVQVLGYLEPELAPLLARSYREAQMRRSGKEFLQ